MTMNWKRNSKKYIAGILTIALAVGASQSYGSMEVSAQERTLPGIEKLVQDTVASSDGTFHILEIVPSKENATIGYLAGGEEPVSEGRKLSEMPSATERQTAMDSLDAAKFPTTGPVTFSAYSGKHRSFQNRGRKRTLCIPTGRIRQIQLSTDRCGLSRDCQWGDGSSRRTL